MTDDPTPPDPSTEHVGYEDLVADLDELADDVGSADAREQIHETKQFLAEATDRGLIESDVRTLEPSDTAQALVGSVVFASPLLIEDGVFDIADYLFHFTLGGIPVFLLLNTAFVIFMTYALLEWTGRARTETHFLFGVIPLRLLMVLSVSFLVSAALMTVWGRITWQPPVEAIARINVLWTVGSLGAALGDVLSGDSP